MTTSAEYFKRAEECARLANLTTDDLIKRDLLLLRQEYLRTAASLKSVSG